MNRDNYQTPAYIFEQLNNIFAFTHDAACNSDNCLAPVGFYHDKGIDGLAMSWKGARVFCNPPFSKKKDWIRKAHEEVSGGGCPVCIMILPLNCMSIASFQTYVIEKGYRYDILHNRIAFINPETCLPQSGNDTGTVIVYFLKKVRI